MNNEVVSIEYKGDIIGTGFFVLPNLIMTCEHVIKGKRNLKAVVYYTHKKVIIDTTKIFINKKLDYALLAICEDVENNFNFGTSRKIKQGQSFTIECPHSKPTHKLVTLTPNSGMYDEDLYNHSFVLHGDICLPGTSGSPLLNDKREIVGLHWASGLRKYKHNSFSVPIDLIKHNFYQKKDLITKKLSGL